jgi:hypothetical protein
MRSTVFLILSFFLILWVSCTERIDIDPGEGTVRLIVEGSITTKPMAHKVLLSTTAGYFSNQPLPVVSGATVSISDGNTTFRMQEIAPGRYQTDPGVYGIPGHLYTLKIKLASPVGGYSEYSATTAILPPTQLDSIQLKFNPTWSEKGMWEVKGFFRDSPAADFYRFLIYRNGVLVTDTLNEWYVTDDQFFNNKYLLGTTLGWLQQHREDEALKTGDLVTAEVDVIEKEFSEFIWGARIDLYGTNPLFSGPPANVKGNINNGAIGYFAAYTLSRASRKVPDF